MKEKRIELINPFIIDVEPMDRLLLVNFEKDPDSVYIGFEPQVFNDSLHGKGHLIIAWRGDGKVDVYHESSLTLKKENYDIVGNGLENMIPTDFSNAFYEINDTGVKANYQFDDFYNRRIKIIITEENPKKRKPFSLLAPMGDAAKNPSALPLIFLHDFYFVRRKATELKISIDEKLHQPDALPVPMDGAKMFYTRYSPRPLIARFNPAFNGVISPVYLFLDQKKISNKDYDIHIQWENDLPGIKSIVRKNQTYPIRLDFPEVFPNIRSLENSAVYEGTFVISGDAAVGNISGHYHVERTDHAINLKLVPSGGWKPKPTKVSLNILYIVAKIFTTWPKTYKWTATIHHDNGQNLQKNSRWERI